MAGLALACPGHPRLASQYKNVDARDKARARRPPDLKVNAEHQPGLVALEIDEVEICG